MEFLKIFGFCVGAAIIYGIIHDQFTAHICVEYFSIAHPTILPLKSPALLAIQWGILATWWVGAALGLCLASSARLGPRLQKPAAQLVKPVISLLLGMALASLVAGIVGYSLAVTHKIALTGFLEWAIPRTKHARFMADWWAHSAAYLVGIVGGLILCGRTYSSRARSDRTAPFAKI